MQTLKQRAREKMLGYVGMTEPTGDNDHAQFEKANRVFGYDENAFYCATLVMLAFLIALVERRGADAANESVLRRHVPDLLALMPVSGSTTALMNGAKARGMWIPPEQWQKVEPGDLVLFDFTKPGGELMRHTGMVLAKPGGKIVWTVEGNTLPESGQSDLSNDARRNGGVWKRRRLLASRPGYRILGYVRTPT